MSIPNDDRVPMHCAFDLQSGGDQIEFDRISVAEWPVPHVLGTQSDGILIDIVVPKIAFPASSSLGVSDWTLIDREPF